MRRVLAANEKPLNWVGSSKRTFLDFPASVKDDMGNALGIAQFGGRAPTAKDLVAERLKKAQEDYEENHAKPKQQRRS